MRKFWRALHIQTC